MQPHIRVLRMSSAPASYALMSTRATGEKDEPNKYCVCTTRRRAQTRSREA